jgi:hypothetical protein
MNKEEIEALIDSKIDKHENEFTVYGTIAIIFASGILGGIIHAIWILRCATF